MEPGMAGYIGAPLSIYFQQIDFLTLGNRGDQLALPDRLEYVAIP